jgi:NAD(P)-dependent dehydrogenase (short-subunit alcohol dehydrogenase family)
VHLDVTGPASIAAAVGRIDREEGALDILVNNGASSSAQCSRQARPGAGHTGNLRDQRPGVIALTNAMLPLLRRTRAGRIVNRTSDPGSLAKASTDPAFPQGPGKVVR